MDYRERWELKEYQSEQRLGRRAMLLHAIIAFALVGFLGVFWYLQIVKGSEFACWPRTTGSDASRSRRRAASCSTAGTRCCLRRARRSTSCSSAMG
jgi:hypothetical protein